MKVKTYTKKDFAWAKWDAKTIRSFVPKIIAQKKKVYAEIKKIPPEKRTFENTLYALEQSEGSYESVGSYVHLLSMVSPIDSVRQAAQATEKELSRKMVDIEYDKGLYRALLEYSKGNRKTESLLPEENKMLTDALKGYRRMGFDLPNDKQKLLKSLMKELSKLSKDFESNLSAYKDHILVTLDELRGLPERYIQGLEKDKRTGKYKVTLKSPDLVPFVTHAENEIKRKELIDKDFQEGGVKNLKIIEKAVKLRHQKAKLLGYRNHTEFVTEMRMVKTASRAIRFVTGLAKRLKKGARRDLRSLVLLKRQMTENPKAKITYYDVGYYAEKFRQKNYKINNEKIREYFPFERVIAGTFEIYQKLFGVTFHELSGYPTWHEDVQLYCVRERGKIISYFMLDLYPRDNKYGHACALKIIAGRNEGWRGKDYLAPAVVMITNFPKPRPGVPSLLSPGEARTFFHEFGHLMHVALTKARYASQSGYDVVWDFAEAPSQMLENWTWDKKMLKLLSGHYKTGEPLPDSEIGNLLRAKRALECLAGMRQLALSYFDLFIHTQLPKLPLEKIEQKITNAYTGIIRPRKSIFPAAFGHLMGGYDAGYYGYLWSLVYAADMFTRFKKEGLLNPKTGGDYRKWILEKGSSMEEIELVKKFLGRKPNNKAFLKEIGAIQ